MGILKRAINNFLYFLTAFSGDDFKPRYPHGFKCDIENGPQRDLKAFHSDISKAMRYERRTQEHLYKKAG